MSQSLDGKVALVTGAKGGIGAAIADAFEEAGAIVIRTDVDGEGLALKLDVTHESDWKRAIRETLEQHGRLDVLVNNAGIFFMKPIAETTLEEFQRLHAINVQGVFLGMRAAARAMAAGGSIINISSVAANKAFVNHVAYGSSKAAVSGMTRAFAAECADNGSGIRVNAICPGVVRTPMLIDTPENIRKVTEAHPLGICEPEDVAALALYLASDESRRVTGADLTVDGGLTIKD